MIPSKEYLSYIVCPTKMALIKKFVFKPLFESCAHLQKIPGIEKIKETEINKKLYLFIKENSSISNIVGKLIIVQYKPKDVVGDKEPEPDFRFIIPPFFGIFFEAKRIYKKDSFSTYCGGNGLDRFLREYYSIGDKDGGMIAYVQTGVISDVKEKITGLVEKIDCIKMEDNDGGALVFSSIHKRKTKGNIKIYHLFFDLT